MEGEGEVMARNNVVADEVGSVHAAFCGLGLELDSESEEDPARLEEVRGAAAPAAMAAALRGDVSKSTTSKRRGEHHASRT